MTPAQRSRVVRLAELTERGMQVERDLLSEQPLSSASLKIAALIAEEAQWSASLALAICEGRA